MSTVNNLAGIIPIISLPSPPHTHTHIIHPLCYSRREKQRELAQIDSLPELEQIDSLLERTKINSLSQLAQIDSLLELEQIDSLLKQAWVNSLS